MSRFAMKVNDIWVEEIESMEVCKWRINDVCCNSDCDDVGDYPYHNCDSCGECDYFELEDGIIKEEEWK